MMINQHLSSGRQLVGNIICIDSFDGALHSATNTKDNNIVSFNSQLYHRDFSLHGISTASSKNILTWMNSLTDETVATIFPIIIPIFEEQLQLQSEIIRPVCCFYFFQMHDAKLIYLLCQHAQ